MIKPSIVACHLKPHSLYDEGFAHVLDNLQGRAGVDALFLDAIGSDYPNRLAPQQSLADHGRPLRDRDQPCARRWFPSSDQLLRDCGLRWQPEHDDAEYRDVDVYAQVAAPAAERGMAVHVRLLEYAFDAVADDPDVCEIDTDGARNPLPCWRHPRYRQFWATLGAHLVGHYGLDGFHFGAERNGPLSQALIWGGPIKASCFCEHCLAAAEAHGIDADRARAGFAALAQIVAGPSRREHALLRILRTLTHFPEVLAWERLWTEGRNAAWGQIRAAVKAVQPQAQVGWHIWQYTCSLDLLARCSLDYSEWPEFSDYIKPCLYHDSGGGRLAALIENQYRTGLLRDCAPELIFDLVTGVFGHDRGHDATPVSTLRQQGLGAGYVGEQCAIAKEAIGDRCQLWAGIGLNIGGGLGIADECERIGGSVEQAMANGADGLVLCREYQEMTWDSLDAVGRALSMPNRVASAIATRASGNDGRT